MATLIAFIPAAFTGVVLEKAIKDKLFGVWPVIVAWIVAAAILFFNAELLWLIFRGQ